MNPDIVFNKILLFTAEAYLQKSLDEGLTGEQLHKDIISGINSYRMMGRFNQKEQKLVMDIGEDPFIKKLKDVKISHIVYALELLRLWVTETPHSTRRNIYIGVGNKKLKIGAGRFVMSMLALKKADKEKYDELRIIIDASKLTAKQFFFYMHEEIHKRIKEVQ